MNTTITPQPPQNGNGHYFLAVCHYRRKPDLGVRRKRWIMIQDYHGRRRPDVLLTAVQEQAARFPTAEDAETAALLWEQRFGKDHDTDAKPNALHFKDRRWTVTEVRPSGPLEAES